MSLKPSTKLSQNRRMHPYAHALRRQREYLNEVALANTLPPPRNFDAAPDRNVAEKIHRALNLVIFVLFIACLLLRLLNIILIKEIIATLDA
ncbi:hypothetical protein GGU11DRAFT_740678 [Lentinula aff. detonsa]|uniref:Uncharacterized protein n=1 Tax=Lentinula aff. detonsa TaxID=2804958 RepID=A0AA38KWI3_9AGAR|nr:hypothetical protein GGU10DRAFT_375318 [Lentinula aff. detonsa]KAJ3802391.1 hypothetical protein GGU11DRAFT_740678 [Lentinula aff. detonsa]